MRAVKTILIFCAGVTLLSLLAVGTYLSLQERRTDAAQNALEPFYTAPAELPPKPGTLIRSEPLTGTFDLPDAAAYRILYTTEGAKGQPRISSGMAFIPNSTAPSQGRTIVSWAHPTVGMGDACAPSRRPTPTALMDWLPAMLAKGWIVTATDYAGLGTAGDEAYLIAASEVHDVVNAVRAARALPEAEASAQYTVFGHSQGGHAALWAGTLAPRYAPELDLLGVAGAAPAAPLEDLVSRLWDTTTAWVIGAEVFVSYPSIYPDLEVDEVGTPVADRVYRSLADECLIEGGIDSEFRAVFGEKFFARDPLDIPAWRAAITDQTAPPTPADMPVLVTQSVNDGVVLAPSIAAMQQQWCAAGSDLDVTWLGPLRGDVGTPSIATHMYEGAVGGSVATTWFERLFAGDDPGPRTCSQTPPLVG